MSRSVPGRALARCGLVLAAVTATVAALAAPAQAFPQASFHTLSTGNRGVDVLAAQYLLQARGHSASADGVFGAGTAAAVRSFQASAGLGQDGVLGAQTWAALVVTVREGSTGPAVRAVQAQLNKKRRLGLPVDGVFGAGTAAAVRSFQSHAGIGADGVVGPTTWRTLIWHYAYPSLAGMCDKDPDGNGTANWGTGSTIGQLEAAVADYGGGNGPVPLGDVSFEHGGDIPG
ncbi:MAG TPA: peptidoglycan-binding protein, partial [Actinoplanes sp.]|nr:peptidoglycan-binding protein [Actinoplanes sp.]